MYNVCIVYIKDLSMHHVISGEYICTKCKVKKPYTAFYRDGRKKTGLSSWCISCNKIVALAAKKRRRQEKFDEISNMYNMSQKKESE